MLVGSTHCNPFSLRAMLVTVAVTEVTRLAIIDEMKLSTVWWAGRLEETDFLARLYDLTGLPSTDSRYADASGDIWQHRVNNYDWEDDWIWYDDRFDLLRGPDDKFLKFLAETVHPAVRPDQAEAQSLVEAYNRHLRHDGVELTVVTEISGRPVYAARSTLVVPLSLREVERRSPVLDSAYLTQQITRMETSIETDPELAIGTAKELVETCCRTILAADSVEAPAKWDMGRLVKETTAHLELTPSDARGSEDVQATVRTVLGSLSTVVGGIAELRNAHGTGHGKQAGRTVRLSARHARLAVGAASTVATFLFETYERRGQTRTTGD